MPRTPKLKPLHEQVIVITGASSGIGLATARLAAQAGARLVVAARSDDALRQLEDELRARGCDALAVTADVAKPEDVRRIANEAVARFGRIDTWVNNAAVAIYGRAEEVPLDEHRRLFDVNYFGVVTGSLEALRVMRRQDAGAVINVGSVESDLALPYHSAYGASKHAIKGFTDVLRVEVERDGIPVSITLIKPGSINTPFTTHARNYMDREPTYPPPVYEPRVVARAILHAAQKPVRDIIVGAGGKLMSSATNFPPLADFLSRNVLSRQQKSSKPARLRGLHTLYEGAHDLRESGTYEGRVMRSSAYTAASLHPVLTLAALAAAGAAIYAIASAARSTPGARRGTNAPLPNVGAPTLGSRADMPFGTSSPPTSEASGNMRPMGGDALIR